ncbi:MAG: hypothetical protein JO103_08230, partial [Candidatus Eremiobacteraeota bacterium]|nr:hypothetical protein [Candidatus Eremiobacteraeota bacterium]
MTDVSDFQRESYRIDEQIWDALALRSGERALFLGVANEGAWIARAVEIGVDVTVLGASDATAPVAEKAGASIMRGSATMIPASEAAYDVAVAMHYLHEIDPGFHAQVVSELARVGKRVAVVEPSPPADLLGKRIAALYGRAKREAGQFESYQPIEYWRKLLAIVKADVWQNLFTFTRVPPKHQVAETVSLILEAMAIEEMPQGYLDELREIAARPDAQLLPLSRIVLVGTAAGEALPHGSGEPFRPYVAPTPAPARSAGTPPRTSAPAGQPAPPAAPPSPPAAPVSAPPPSFGFAPDEPPSFGIARPQPPASPPAEPAPPRVSSHAPPASPFGAPFALPDEGEEEP